MTNLPLETLDQLKEKVAEVEQAGPRLRDAVSRAAYAYQYTCEALKSHFPFHIHGLRKELKAVAEELAEQLESVGRLASKPADSSLPRITRDLAANGGLAFVVKHPAPIIIDGGASSCEAVKTWTPRFFADNYGGYELPLAKGSIQDAKGTIAQVVADIESGLPRGHYVHNVANFFNENRHLEDQLPIKEFLEHVQPAQHFGCQLFLGGPKTGTSWHNASGWNFFFMVHGRKHWFMSHPGVSPWMYGRMHPSGSVGLSPVDHARPADEQKGEYPLYAYVPVFDSVLEPGDVLVVPPWWWHAIINVTPSTIGVSTRWLNPTAAETSPAFRLTQGLMPSFQEFEKEAIEMEENFRIRDKYVRDTYDNAGFKSDIR